MTPLIETKALRKEFFSERGESVLAVESADIKV